MGNRRANVGLLPPHSDGGGACARLGGSQAVPDFDFGCSHLSAGSRYLKRSLDLVIAVPAGLVLLPLMFLLGAAIKLDSPGPALFRQRRIGKDGRAFFVTKFRTMVVGAEAMTGALLPLSKDPNWLLLDHDPRLTRLGRALRTSSLDELPQLWNVVKGEMSLVGPRPLVESEYALLTGCDRVRGAVPPGLTGLWQVMGRTSISFEEMITLDCLYVSNWSLWRDLQLLFRTIPVVLTRRGAN